MNQLDLTHVARCLGMLLLLFGAAAAGDEGLNQGAGGKTHGCGFAIQARDDFLSYVTNGDLPATYESTNGNYLFFRSDGTVAGGGYSGEPSLWEADWTFAPGDPTGKLEISLTTPPSTTEWHLNGTYHVEIFPDDAALILNCVDFIETDL